MNAIVRDRYGLARRPPKPIVKGQDVLVRVPAASLNADDLEYLYGKSHFTRMATGLRKPRSVDSESWPVRSRRREANTLIVKPSL